MQSKVDPQELVECIQRIEELGDDVAWSFSKITNDRHSLAPIGRGYGVTINGQTSGHRPEPLTVYEKGLDLKIATNLAITRYKQQKIQKRESSI